MHFTHETVGPWPVDLKLSLVGKAEPVQVRFTLRLRDQWSKCGKMDVKSTWIHTCWYQMDHVSWSLELFKKSRLGDRPSTKLGVYDTCEDPSWNGIRWNSIRLSVPVTYDFKQHNTWGPLTTWHEFGKVLGELPLETSCGLSQFHGDGSCVKWP